MNRDVSVPPPPPPPPPPPCSVVESEILPCLQELVKDDDADVRYFSEESVASVNTRLNPVQ